MQQMVSQRCFFTCTIGEPLPTSAAERRFIEHACMVYQREMVDALRVGMVFFFFLAIYTVLGANG